MSKLYLLILLLCPFWAYAQLRVEDNIIYPHTKIVYHGNVLHLLESDFLLELNSFLDKHSYTIRLDTVSGNCIDLENSEMFDCSSMLKYYLFDGLSLGMEQYEDKEELFAIIIDKPNDYYWYEKGLYTKIDIEFLTRLSKTNSREDLFNKYGLVIEFDTLNPHMYKLFFVKEDWFRQ